MDTTTPPVRCALTGEDYDARLQWLADLTRDGLLGHQRRDLTLDLHYRQDGVDRVRHMVRLEQACCAFLSFEVTEAGGHVRLVITAPESARDVADQLFAQFLPAASDGGDAAATPPAPRGSARVETGF